MIGIIYKNGVIADIAGSLTKKGYENQNIEEKSNYLYAYHTANGSCSNAMFYFNNSIDMTGFNELVINWKMNRDRGENGSCVFGVKTSTPTFPDTTRDSETIKNFNAYVIENTGNNVTEQVVNIKDINQGYVSIFCYDITGYIYSIYMR